MIRWRQLGAMTPIVKDSLSCMNDLARRLAPVVQCEWVDWCAFWAHSRVGAANPTPQQRHRCHRCHHARTAFHNRETFSLIATFSLGALVRMLGPSMHAEARGTVRWAGWAQDADIS